MPEIIVNTSPLQYLYQLGLLDLLPTFYGRVTVPEAVVAELDAGRRLGLALPDLTSLDWITVKPVEQASLLRLVGDLGRGEREVLALASTMPGCVIVRDDGLARRCARMLGLTLTQTLGVLLRAKREGHLPALAPLLDRLDGLRFRVDAATRAAVLRLAGEKS